MKLSIITINYNNKKGLLKTIKSVVNQNINFDTNDYEFIIIDGGSTDGSVDVINEYVDEIDYWVSKKDKGIYNAMNKGIDIANGEYCLFLNSGDTFYDSYTLQLCFPYLDGTDVLAGGYKIDLGEVFNPPRVITFEKLYNHQQPCHQSSFIRTKLLKKYHYDEKYKLVSDWKFFIQIFIYDNSSYKPMEVVVSVYDTCGISSQNRSLLDKEHVCVLENDFPKRIYDYYIYNTASYGDRLFNVIRRSKCKRFLDVIAKILFILFRR